MKFVNVFIFAALLQGTALFGCCGHEQMETAAFETCEKTYVASSQINMQEGKIFVQLEDYWGLTDTLYTDEGGFYFKTIQAAHGCPSPYIKCRNPRCGQCVYPSY